MERKTVLQLSRPPYTDLGAPRALVPLFGKSEPASIKGWEQKRMQLEHDWESVIGKPSFGEYDRTVAVSNEIEHPDWQGVLLWQPVAPGIRQKILVMKPKKTGKGLSPGAVVPFYHPDDSAGFDLTMGVPIATGPTIQFGLHLVRQGYTVVCTEAFPYNTVQAPADNKGFAWWQAAADKVLADNPGWTGIGRLIWDTSRAVDLLLSLEGVDPDHILAIGHSLGGKMAFCTAAFDQRIKAVIASDFGIAWDFTNWEADWYFGKQIQKPDFYLDGHHLLALIAPRPFLLIAGQYDKPESWQYVNEAKKVYRLYQKEDNAGVLDHASGHRPPETAMNTAYRWLAEQFNEPYPLFGGSP